MISIVVYCYVSINRSSGNNAVVIDGDNSLKGYLIIDLTSICVLFP